MQKPNSWLCFQSLKSIKSTLELIKSNEFPFLHSRNDFDLFSCLYLNGFRFYSRIPFSVKIVFEDGNVNGVEIYLWHWDGIRRFRPLSSSPLRVRPYLIPCSPPHFSSSTPSSRVRPLIEWYPDELICDEGTSRMCQMSRQRRPFWISAIAWNLLGNWVDGIN